MKKQIEVWEGIVEESKSFYTEGWVIDSDKIEDIVDTISDYKHKKVRVTIEVIE